MGDIERFSTWDSTVLGDNVTPCSTDEKYGTVAVLSYFSTKGSNMIWLLVVLMGLWTEYGART